MRKILTLAGVFAAFALTVGMAGAQESGGQPNVRRGTGLPVPRYVSLRTDRVNLREGPSKDHRTAWVYQRAGLPVEIVAEYDNWRRIRDSEGTEGWVLQSLLSGRRTALVLPWAKNKAEVIPLVADKLETAGTVARMQPNVIVNVKKCDGTWCRVAVPIPNARDNDGYIRQEKLWGVYPGEKVD